MITTALRTNVRVRAVMAIAMAASVLAIAPPAWANHPVFVEGNCFGPGMGDTATGLRQSPVTPGTCGDYDGDGSIGMAEDNDGDNNFGTINAALTAVAQNGRVTIVANGTYGEVVTLNPVERGNVTLEAAPGVSANIDAVVQGDPGSTDRQQRPGIIVDGCRRCRVTVRNVITRNWTDRVRVRGFSHLHLDQVISENNLNYGIRVKNRAKVSISNSQVNASGFRKNTAGAGEPNPGIGVEFEDYSRGSIVHSSITGSARAGINVESQAWRMPLELEDVQLFDNNPNFTQRRARG